MAEIEAIYNSAPVGLGVLDTDLRFQRINKRLAEMNGFQPQEHIGRSIRELLPDVAEDIESPMRGIIETGEPVLNMELGGETAAQPGVRRFWVETLGLTPVGFTDDGRSRLGERDLTYGPRMDYAIDALTPEVVVKR